MTQVEGRPATKRRDTSMNRSMHRALVLGIFLALAAGTGRAAAAEERWQLRVAGVSAQSTAGGGLNGSLGWGLGLEYRASRRLGVELGGLSSEFDSEAEIEFLGLVRFRTESSLRMTPVLARLNVHLTPDRRADLYLGPVLGYVGYSDIEVRAELPIPGFPIRLQDRIETEDEFAWGAHLGLDVRLGGGHSFLTAGATFLKAPVTVRDGDEGQGSFDLDPLVFHLGYGHRF
jgi:hypothetical protein